jgi:hypothetical protein
MAQPPGPLADCLTQKPTFLRFIEQPSNRGIGAAVIAETVMVMVGMSCIVCGHCWVVSADLIDEEVQLLDDPCPMCASQGEPEEVVCDQDGS